MKFNHIVYIAKGEGDDKIKNGYEDCARILIELFKGSLFLMQGNSSPHFYLLFILLFVKILKINIIIKPGIQS